MLICLGKTLQCFRYESAKLRALRALVSHVTRVLRALVPHVLRAFMPRTLPALVPHVPRSLCAFCLTCLVSNVFSCLTCLTCPCTSWGLCLAFFRAARASNSTCSYAPRFSLASGVSSLTCCYAYHVL